MTNVQSNKQHSFVGGLWCLLSGQLPGVATRQQRHPGSLQANAAALGFLCVAKYSLGISWSSSVSMLQHGLQQAVWRVEFFQ